jgi:hypothetical protein
MEEVLMRSFLTLAAVAAGLALTVPALAAEDGEVSLSGAKQIVREQLAKDGSQLRVGTAEASGTVIVVTVLTPEGIPARKVKVDQKSGKIQS